MSAPTPTIAGCQGRSRCIKPAMGFPSGDHAGDTMYSLVNRIVSRTTSIRKVIQVYENTPVSCHSILMVSATESLYDFIAR